MSYSVSITNDEGRILVVVSGGDQNFSQSFNSDSLYVKVYEASETFSLLKVESDETVCTFTKDTCVAPSAASAELLMAALNTLLGAGQAATIAAVEAAVDVLGALIGAADASDTGSVVERQFTLQNTLVAMGTIFAPKTAAITQLTTSGQSAAFNALGGVGSFVYIFVKNAGTSGIIAIEGSNDSTNWVPIPSIVTASLVADGKGVLSWDIPFKQVRVDFAQTGAGSTVDGTFYAK